MMSHIMLKRLDIINWKTTASLFKLMSQQISPKCVMLIAFIGFVNDVEIQENFSAVKNYMKQAKTIYI